MKTQKEQAQLLKTYFLIPEPIRKFLNDYNSSIDYFHEAIEHCAPQWSSYKQSINTIRNTDLWIEAHIELFPDLIEFRKYIRQKMKEVGVDPHPDFAYKPEYNHYYFKGSRTWELLSKAVKEESYDT